MAMGAGGPGMLPSGPAVGASVGGFEPGNSIISVCILACVPHVGIAVRYG
jgi:hypothetical protein